MQGDPRDAAHPNGLNREREGYFVLDHRELGVQIDRLSVGVIKPLDCFKPACPVRFLKFPLDRDHTLGFVADNVEL